MDVTENKIEKMKAQIVILEHEILRLKSRLNMPTSPGFNTSINAVCATQKEYFREKLAKSFRRRKTMEVNFNGARINLARAYNVMLESSDSLDSERIIVARDRLCELMSMVGAFLAMYDLESGYEDLSHIDLKDPYDAP
jgi:hypothetical protein